MRHFLSLADYTKEQLTEILNLAQVVKNAKTQFGCPLIGKTLALLFQKPSLRTRVSFSVGIYELGGSPLYLGPEDARLGQRESVADFAKVLSRYVHGLVIRSFAHEDILRCAAHATIPVINGLSDLMHPCQALGDLFTILERKKTFKKICLAYVGDGNNVLHSLLHGAGIMGMRLVYSTPVSCQPQASVVQQAQEYAKGSGAEIWYESDPSKAVQEADFIYTDTWVSMGQEQQREEKLHHFGGFQINTELLAHAKKNYAVMHCLPAHRGEEITDEVMDGPHSLVYDQAENRLHVQKAILIKLLK